MHAHAYAHGTRHTAWYVVASLADLGDAQRRTRRVTRSGLRTDAMQAAMADMEWPTSTAPRTPLSSRSAIRSSANLPNVYRPS